MTRIANQLTQAIQHRVCLFSSQVLCLAFLFLFHLTYCNSYVSLSYGYDEITLIQVMLSPPIFEILLVFVFKVLSFYDHVYPYALPCHLYSLFHILHPLLVELSKPLATNYLSFCWPNSGVTLKSDFEFRKLINKYNLDPFTVQWNLLINNLKIRLEVVSLTAPKLKFIKFPASQIDQLSLIEFPVPRVYASIQTRPKGTRWTLQARLNSQPIDHFLFDPSCPLLPPICQAKYQWEIDDECLFKTPYAIQDDDEYIISADSDSGNNSYLVLTAYKHVDKKIHPVSMQLPPDCEVI